MNLKKSVVAMIAALCLMGMVGCGGSSSDSSSGGSNGGSSGGETPVANKAPVADVEEYDIKTHVGEPVDLSADPSSDEDNDSLDYAWSLELAPAGSTAELSDPEVANPSFVPDKCGMYRFKLVVSDGKDESEPAYVTVVTGFTLEVADGVILEFAYIPPGTFTMGSPLDEPGRQTYEVQHEVTLSEGYFMMTTELTNRQWETIDQGVWTPPEPGSPHLEVEGADYPARIPSDKARALIDKLNALGMGTFDLPTEAQWEYAARAGSEKAFANGDFTTFDSGGNDPNLEAMGWYRVNSGGDKHEVAQKEPNAWGLYDMHGNVREMCIDLWNGTSSYREEPVVDPVNGDLHGNPVVRGGDYASWADECRSAARDTGTYAIGDSHYPETIGFRLVRELETDPVMVVGPERTTVVGTPIVLDASGSYDPDGYPVSYEWRLIERNKPEGSTATLVGEFQEKATFTPDVPGYYEFQLEVSDNGSAHSWQFNVDAHVVDKLVLFSVPEKTGNLGGRAGADQLAKDAYNLPWDAWQVHAFLSVTEEDCIKNMPKNYGFPDNIPVYVEDGTTKVAENWADLLDGFPSDSLDELNFLGMGPYWWSGSKPDGTLANNCNGWTEGDGASWGAVGHIFSADKSWLCKYTNDTDEYVPIESNITTELIGIAIITRSVHKPENLRLFATKELHASDAGGREGINRLCREDANRPRSMPNVYGFVSVSDQDRLADMHERFGFPTNIPIVGSSGKVIADNWFDLFGAVGPLMSLDDAGVFDFCTAKYWWSGSTPSGIPGDDANMDTAFGWTRTGAGASATYGDSDAEDGEWVFSGTEAPLGKLPFIGIGY